MPRPVEFNSIEVEDDEHSTTSNGEGLTIREIILRQYQRCITEGSKEMSEGGIIQRFVNGQVIEVPSPNQQEIFTSSVMGLLTLVIPFAKDRGNNLAQEYFEREAMIMNSYKELKAQIFEEGNGNHDYMHKKQRIMAQNNMRLRTLNQRLATAKIKNTWSLLIKISMLLHKINYMAEAQGTW